MAATAGEGRKVRYAVVGLGHIAQTAVLPGFQNTDSSELAALVSGDPRKRDVLGRRHGVQAVGYDGYDALLESGAVDAVYLALPNHLHADYAIRAARAGVHVLVEKPMAVTEAEAEAMIAAAKEAGVKLMVAYRLHFEAANLEVVEIVRGGRLGEARLFESAFTVPVRRGDIRLGPVAQGGGALWDLGTYCVNAARYLFGEEPVEALAYSASTPGDPRFERCDETTSAILAFPGGRTAAFTVSFGTVARSYYRVAGTEGEVRVDPAYDYAQPLAYEVAAEGATERRTFPRRDQFGPELVHFSQSILGRSPLEPDGTEGLADVRIVRALHESARTGRRVTLEPVPRRRRPRIAQALTRPAVAVPEAVRPEGGSRP